MVLPFLPLTAQRCGEGEGRGELLSGLAHGEDRRASLPAGFDASQASAA